MRPEYMLEIHRIGHGMNDVKATINRNIELQVGDTAISGKEGEMINIPLWVGEILQRSNLAELDVSDAVTDLKQALIKEQVAGEYQMATLDERFYIRLRHQMKGLDRHDRDGVEGIMMELVRMRRGKIVRLADSSRLTGELKSKITIEERLLYGSISRQGGAFEAMVTKNE
ncbi:MAG: DNA replication complex GINS family protein [Nitrosopumilaceae archaeon]|nr:DNA replication complex GINS family protein [Nitrosopumilaceae archaeon]